MKKPVSKPMIAGVLLVAASFAIFFAMSKHQSGVYYGEVESLSYDICASVPGVIQEVLVKEGDSVCNQTIVMKLDASDATLNYQKALLLEENAKLQALKTSSPARGEELRIQYNNIKQLEEQKNTLKNSLEKTDIAASQTKLNLEALKESYELKRKSYQDLEQLQKAGFESQKNLDIAKIEMTNAQNAYESAKLQIDALNKDNDSLQSQIASVDLQITSANEKLKMMENGLDSNDQQIAMNASKVAEMDQKKSALLLSKYDIASAVDGIVESVNYKKGEFVNTGAPVVSVVDSTQRHVTIYVQETDLTKIAVGDTLDLSIVSDQSVLVSGTVSKVSETSMFTPANIVTTKDRGRLVFPVEISLAASDAIAPGMLLEVKLKGGN